MLIRVDLIERLRAAGCVFAEEEAAALQEVATGVALEHLVRRRVAGEPLEYLVGNVSFDGRRYRLSPGVFIPRQRSTFLVEVAANLGGNVILDLCCGCGALGLAVRDRIDPATELIASDISPIAIADARSNGVADAFVGDLFDAVPLSLQARVDLLLANAPYVPTGMVATMPRESRDFEPRAAIDGGVDGMDVQRRVFARARPWLSATGHVVTETSTAQSTPLAAAAHEAGLRAQILSDDERGATVLVAAPA